MDKQSDSLPSRRLFEEFAPVSTRDWEEKIREDLQGADYEKKLYWDSGQGFRVRPYYRKEDLMETDFLAGFPGMYPYVRGCRLTGNEWLIRQDLRVDDFEQANHNSLDILMKGVDSLGYILDERKTYTYEQIDTLFKNIFAESVESNFICGNNSPAILEIILALVTHYNRSLDKIRGSVDFDPLGELVVHGRCKTGMNECFGIGKKLIERAEHLPHFHVLCVHGNLFHHAGASIAEELGFSLAAGVEYLTQLTERGLSVNKVAPRIRFQFAMGSNHFLEIARFRAARFLWSQIVKAYGSCDESVCRTYIHATTSEWNMTRYDSFVNVLRSTTESMSAVIGGADSLTVMPFNAILEEEDPFATRIARNQQLILKEESYLDKVADPSAGSYYIENLTAMLIERAWKIFLQVEEHGGFLQAFLSGTIQEQINKTAKERDMAIATRKEILLGTNQYPSFNEKNKSANHDTKAFTGEKIRQDGIAEPLLQYRGADGFERIRLSTDRYALFNERPRIFMLTYGNLALRRARAQFACNFFACAGYEVIDNIGFETLDEGIRAARDNRSRAVVLCSSDDEYTDITRAAVEELNSFSIAVIAGLPKEIQGQLQSYGIRYFIHARSNIQEVLGEFQKEFGIG